ncbi:hypothetical protein H4Q32_018255 [Labeo rohita]|uniref:LRR and PYD domains-containing 3-like protein n=1 Tax=Labeo rohita TaxID=84645 RepID=A0ABQ8LBV2_LABRO|nr:hypothetical protein H4Q32_018255 [Labeo rohita]
MVCQYKKSVDWKDLNERSFPSGERVSLAALYTEPVIIQKNKKGSFLNVSVEELFSKSNLCLYYPTIILQGNPGSGKSVIAQKILLDWASEKPYLEDFDLTFCLRYEEVKCISEEMNLIELLSWSCSLTSSQISRMVLNSVQRVLLIIDGLDEPDELRFICDEFCISSKFQRASPEVIVCSLLRQQILPRSVLLITTRTKFPHGMLLEGQQRFFRIVGFSEKEVEEYFHKFFQNEELFRKVYEFVRKNETLITACSIPVMCWIICMVLRERFCEGAHVTSGLETTTSIYVDFVSTLLEHHCQGLSQSVLTLLRSLGQLAERGMLEQQVLFDEKTVSETMSDPFLCKRKISQEMMFSFMHHSFQEFFTALYYVLLDEEESKRKVRELLRTVEKGWALSCWSDREANLEISKSKLLQPVILFVCGLCKKEWVSSFFEKHNMAVSVNVETQLKEWLNQCSQRYQNEHMLFILHCLYELHEKSFTGKVLEQLVSMDLSNVQLENAHRWMLRFCFQNCVNIGKLRLSITCDDLKILQSTPYRCEELIHQKASLKKRTKGFCQEIIISIKDEDVIFPLKNETIIVKSAAEVFLQDVLHSVSGLKKVHLQIDKFTGRWIPTVLSLVWTFPSLNELGWRKSVLLERDMKSFTEEDLKTMKKENIESKSDAELFTPECVQQDDEDKHKTTYRFVCPHVGQFRCSLTSLVFVMEGEGEVLYRVVSWDPRLFVGFDQKMTPAGPLYNIDCFNGSLSKLHLPHCEIFSEKNKDSLDVAHFTCGNVEIMKPLQVTETHVMIDIKGLSLYGLLKRLIFPPSPVAAQVLLFLRPIIARQRENVLDVHLLPLTVPLSEVKNQHWENTHIKTSSKCSLTPGSEYSLCCQPEGCTTEKFECDFGPNYHPTFEVFVNVETDEVRLSLLDKTEEKEVWVPRRILLTVINCLYLQITSGKDADPPAQKRLTECEFVKKTQR